jgi:hypothetical protein
MGGPPRSGVRSPRRRPHRHAAGLGLDAAFDEAALELDRLNAIMRGIPIRKFPAIARFDLVCPFRPGAGASLLLGAALGRFHAGRCFHAWPARRGGGLDACGPCQRGESHDGGCHDRSVHHCTTSNIGSRGAGDHSSGVQGFAETSQVKCVAVTPGVSRLESDAAQFAKREPYLCATKADHLLRAREHALCRNTFGGVGKVRL